MPETETIQVLGRGTNVNFSIDDTVPFEVAERSLRRYLSGCRGLYSRGTVTVNVGRRILEADQMAAIKGILGQETGLTVTCYWCPPEVLSRALSGPQCRPALPSPLAKTADSHLNGQVDEPAPPETATPERSQEYIKADPIGPAVSCETSRPEGQQLSLMFPELDGEQSVFSAMPAVGEDSSSTQMSHGEVGQAMAGEESSPNPAEEAEDEELPVYATRNKESVAESVSQDSSGDVEAGGEAAHAVFQSMLSRGSQALIIKSTCRSGEVIQYPGDVVIFGDVNPGAEIVADGDIMVLGALRGMAHAGADGNLKATILALNLESHRLQIGSFVGERPRGGKKGRGGGKAVNPQIAFLRRRSIFVAPFERRCEEYGGGVPYEG